MNSSVQNSIDQIRSKVEKLVASNIQAEKELKKLTSENEKLQQTIKTAKEELEKTKNDMAVTDGMNSVENKAKLIKQLNHYIKLIDTSVAQIKSKNI